MAQEAEISPELTSLEQSVLEAAIGESGAEIYRAQVAQAQAVVRTPSGVGFVTKLRVPEALRLTDLPAGENLPLVLGDHPDLPSGAEFVLQVKDGRINSIEAFCYEGMWPSDESLFRIDAKR